MPINDIRLKSRTEDGVLIIAPEGNILGGEGTQTLRTCIQENLLAGTTRIVLDLAQVDFVNSMGLGVFLSMRAMVSRQKGIIVIAAPTVHVDDLFRMTQANQIFPMYDAVETAVKECKAWKP